MNRRYINLILIFVLLALAIWIDLPNNAGIGNFKPKTVLGLDLKGGMQVILQVDPNFETPFTEQELQTAKQILENRTNALGVTEVNFQVSGTRYIVGELPGATNAEDVIDTIKKTGMLEFVDFGDNPPAAGTVVETDYGKIASADITPTVAPLVNPAPGETSTTTPTVYHTVMTGSDLVDVAATRSNLGKYEVEFVLTDAGKTIFANYTTANIGKYLGIVLDKKVVSTPVIESSITQGRGVIQGQFTSEQANALAVQLRYGSLPIPLIVEQIRVIGPTLGQDSLDKSMLAGLIGFIIVFLFMGIYYRLPGVVADLSILIYAAIAYAVFRSIPVTLTLPGIAGFLLSTGSALDANILIFERMKEELRAGRTLPQAINLGWKRAWPSIRDSNISAIITSAILFWFGSTFGASIVMGFAVTLFLGVLISLFTAIIVTRTFLNFAVEIVPESEKHLGWFGL